MHSSMNNGIICVNKSSYVILEKISSDNKVMVYCCMF